MSTRMQDALKVLSKEVGRPVKRLVSVSTKYDQQKGSVIFTLTLEDKDGTVFKFKQGWNAATIVDSLALVSSLARTKDAPLPTGEGPKGLRDLLKIG